MSKKSISCIALLYAFISMNAQVFEDITEIQGIAALNGSTFYGVGSSCFDVNEDGWVNFPDYQWRLYKNTPDIKCKNKVHEIIEGYKTVAQLPAYEDLSLYHPKTIERQEKQNNYYATL